MKTNIGIISYNAVLKFLSSRLLSKTVMLKMHEITDFPCAQKNLAPTLQTVMKFDIEIFFENLSGKFRFN